VGVRGQPVMNMVKGAERLLILTRSTPHMLFGYDRFSFEVDLLDNEHGLVASRAAGEANGIVWWWSPPGPCYWSGGRVVPLEREITPRVREVHYDSMIFAHQAAEYEARWYWSDDAGDPYRGECYNYLYEKWKEEALGLRVFCAGQSLPGTILRPGPGGAPVPDPDPGEDPTLPAPTNLQHSEITATSARASWTPGIVSPQVVTKVWRKVAGGDFVLSVLGSIPSGMTSVVHTVLEAGKLYTTRVEHVDTTTGLRSAPLEGDFTTLALGVLNPPTGLIATVGSYAFVGIGFVVYVTLRWTPGQTGTFTQIEYKPVGSDWALASKVAAGVNETSRLVSGPSSGGFFNLASGVWTFRARHTSTFDYDEILAPSGSASGWTNEITVDMAATP
jgi:hypothetical protein